MLASLCQTPRPGTAPQEGNLSSFSRKTHACPQDQVCTGVVPPCTRSCFGDVTAMARGPVLAMYQQWHVLIRSASHWASSCHTAYWCCVLVALSVETK